MRLSKLSEETGSEVLGKAEFMNPGGSVKDRAALYVVKEAEEKGEIVTKGEILIILSYKFSCKLSLLFFLTNY